MSTTATPSQSLAEWIRTDERREQIARALPEGVSIDRFERATATALISKPELAKADRASLYLAVLNAAQAGLVPDGKQAAIVVYNTKVKDDQGERWIEKASFIPMIGGVRDTLAEFGWMLQTSVVYENDEFDYDEAEATIFHRPPRLGADRGQLQGAYAKATHKDGRRRMAVVMSKAEIDYVRDKSSRSKKTWDEWYTRMAEKTPAHRLAKKLPLDPKDKQRIDFILDADKLEQGEAATMLYGPRAIIAHELTAGSPGEQEVDPSPPTDTQGAATAGEASSSPPADPAVDENEPGPDDPEPVDGELVDAGEDTQIRALADAAALYKPQSPKWPDMALGEIWNVGEKGLVWFKYTIGVAKRPDLIDALNDFTRFYAPEIFADAEAKRQAQS